MKTFFALILCCLSISLSSHSAETEKIIDNAEITSIKVFLNNAQINRTAKTNVDAGITQVVFENLSANIDKNSILVSGTGDVTILSVVHQLNYLNSQSKTKEIASLEDSLESLNTEMTKLTNMKSVYEEEQSMLLSNKSIGGQNNGITAKNLEEVADLFRKRLVEIKAKLTEISVNEKKLNEKTSKIKSQLAMLNAKKNQPSGSITVNVSAKMKTSITLEISYIVSGAGWIPLYDIRAKDISSPIQFNYKANVYQNTGEDWKNVKLKLSTGNPTQNGTKPTLNTWWLDFYYSYSKMKHTKGRYGDASLSIRGSRSADTTYYVDGMYIAETKNLSKLSENIQVNQNQLSTDFEINIPYSIPTDGKNYLVDVQNSQLKADYSYFAVPKLDKDAFLLARVTGWEDLNLLSGKANIYFEGTFIGESYLDVQNTNDTLDISLGRDKKIVITREKQKDLSSEQFLSGQRVKALTYEIAVRNTKKEAIIITLEDQIPVTSNNDIYVKTIENSGAEYDEKTGKLTWKIKLAPSGTEKKKLSFSVKYPKDKVISGL